MRFHSQCPSKCWCLCNNIDLGCLVFHLTSFKMHEQQTTQFSKISHKCTYPHKLLPNSLHNLSFVIFFTKKIMQEIWLCYFVSWRKKFRVYANKGLTLQSHLHQHCQSSFHLKKTCNELLLSGAPCTHPVVITNTHLNTPLLPQYTPHKQLKLASQLVKTEIICTLHNSTIYPTKMTQENFCPSSTFHIIHH